MLSLAETAAFLLAIRAVRQRRRCRGYKKDLENRNRVDSQVEWEPSGKGFTGPPVPPFSFREFLSLYTTQVRKAAALIVRVASREYEYG